jgi:hypothetical protein
LNKQQSSRKGKERKPKKFNLALACVPPEELKIISFPTKQEKHSINELPMFKICFSHLICKTVFKIPMKGLKISIRKAY